MNSEEAGSVASRRSDPEKSSRAGATGAPRAREPAQQSSAAIKNAILYKLISPTERYNCPALIRVRGAIIAKNDCRVILNEPACQECRQAISRQAVDALAHQTCFNSSTTR